MSGIVGFVDAPPRRSEEELATVVRRMARRLAHRGPDDQGALADGPAGLALGFRRLAVQDLSANGNQPMTSANGRYVIVYDGETFNFRDLKEDLQRAGYRSWRGASDTEVMLAAISRIGVAGLLGRCDGMFAFALWDRQANWLHLARDRMGEKPLYYGWAGSTFMFASELKAFVEHPSWIGTIDRTAVSAFMRFGYVPAPMSIYEGIAKLLPGHWVSFDLGKLEPGTLPAPRPYWDARAVAERAAEEPFDGNLDDAADELDRLLTRSVTQRMIADVPLGAFLSGGVDSSAIAALMQKAAHRPVRTFTLVTGDAARDEAEAAGAMARHLGTNHTEIRAEAADAQDAVERIARIYDEPFADKRQLPVVLLAALTRKHVTAVLSGAGGDALFGGDPRYPAAAGAWASVSRLSAFTRGAARWARTNMPLRLLNALSGSGRLGDTLFRMFSNALDRAPEQVLARAQSNWRVLDAPIDPYQGGYFGDSAAWAALDDVEAKLMFADAVTYLPDNTLVQMDRAGMAAALQARAPLLGREVVEFAWTLPIAFRAGEQESKPVLRRLASRYIPHELLERPEPGFAPPLADWLRGPLRDWAEALLQPEKLSADGLLRPAPVLAAWREHSRGQRDREGDLWPVLMFQAWWADWR
ncbi:MAG: asparagine synthase (glutamine-hydrolyzing) [Gammaproteobacteria bacterium]